MNQQSGFMRWTSRFLMICMMSLVVPASSFASMISTEDATNHALADQGRAKIMALIQRDDISTQLQSKGVTAEQAMARVNSLTDDEALQVSAKLDQLPAGGEVLSLLFTIFVVLLVTDILGFTKVFPFTRTINR